MENLDQQKEEQNQAGIENQEGNKINPGSPENATSDASESMVQKDVEIGALGIMQHSSKEITTPGEVGKVIEYSEEEE